MTPLTPERLRERRRERAAAEAARLPRLRALLVAPDPPPRTGAIIMMPDPPWWKRLFPVEPN